MSLWLLASPAPLLTAHTSEATLHIAAAAPATASGEPLFAAPGIDALPSRTASGPPQLIGIVGRISAPLAMVRQEDGAIRTIGRGDVAGGWTLVSVAADRAIFRQRGEQRVSVLPPRNAP